MAPSKTISRPLGVDISGDKTSGAIAPGAFSLTGAVSVFLPMFAMFLIIAPPVESELDFSLQRDGILGLNPLTIWSKVIQNKVRINLEQI